MAKRDIEMEIAKRIKEQLAKRKIENMPEHLERLRNGRKKFNEKYDFKPGDLVVWKKGMKNKARPAYDEPAIVMEVLKEPLKDGEEQNSGSPYFNEPLDLILGISDEDGDFLIFHYDKRRFEPYQENK